MLFKRRGLKYFLKNISNGQSSPDDNDSYKTIPWTDLNKLAVKNLGRLQLHESMNAPSKQISTNFEAGDNSEHVLSLLLNRK